MRGSAAFSRDRYHPSIFDRLKQSRETKQQLKEKRLGLVPAAQRVVDTPNPERRIISSSLTGNIYGATQTVQIWRTWSTNDVTTSCNTDPWQQWHVCQPGTGGSDPWNQWTTAGDTITIHTNSATTVWNTWQGQEQPQHQRFAETPEQRQRREAEEARWRQEEAARNAKWHEEERVRLRKQQEADDRAMKLLVSMLSDQQRSDLKNHKHFFVDAPSGRLYRIDYGMHGNVKVVDRKTHKIIERLCIQPRGVPAADANLMQKLLIETAEDLFRSHANITLEDGRMLYGKSEDLGAEQLAKVIPLRRAA